MNLFGKEKELIFKIVNGILLIWFIAGIVITANSIIDLIIADPYVNPYNRGENTYQIKFLLGAIANVIIVGLALFFINKPSKTELETKDENKEIK